MKRPSAAQSKAGRISGSTGRLWRGDFFTEHPASSRIYGTGIHQVTPAGTVEYGLSRLGSTSDHPDFRGWLRSTRGTGWLAAEIADEVEIKLWNITEEDDAPAFMIREVR